jgi:hypothetical protein
MISEIIVVSYYMRKDGLELEWEPEINIAHPDLLVTAGSIHILIEIFTIGVPDNLRNSNGEVVTLEDARRIKDRILDKANTQLRQDYINFIAIANWSNHVYDYDVMDAVYGKKIFVEQGNKKWSERKKNGAFYFLENRNLPNLAGVVFFKQDYSLKKIHLNEIVTKNIIDFGEIQKIL